MFIYYDTKYQVFSTWDSWMNAALGLHGYELRRLVLRYHTLVVLPFICWQEGPQGADITQPWERPYTNISSPLRIHDSAYLFINNVSLTM